MRGDRPTKTERLFQQFKAAPGCWEWTGTRNPAGYGTIRTGPRGAVKPEMAHRLMWETIHGPILAGSVLHHCDNPSCVRPDHLYLGTAADNARDRDSRGRNKKAKLTDEKVRLARAAYANGWTNSRLAREFGVSPATMHAVIHGTAWRHVT